MQVRFEEARNVFIIPPSHFGLGRRKKG